MKGYESRIKIKFSVLSLTLIKETSLYAFWLVWNSPKCNENFNSSHHPNIPRSSLITDRQEIQEEIKMEQHKKLLRIHPQKQR